MRELPNHIVSFVHYTELSESGWWDEALERYILATLFEFHEAVQIQQIKKAISKKYLIDFKTHELTLIIDRLEQKGSIISPTSGKYKLSLSKIHDIKESEKRSSDLESKIKSDFCGQAKNFCSEIVAEEIWSAFISKFLIPLVTNEGARSYDLLTGGKKDILPVAYIDNFLNVFPVYRESVKQLLYEFLTKDDSDTKTYLLTYLDSYFLMSAAGLPSKVLNELSNVSKDGLEFTIFVDTNFIYSILNLHDNPSNQAASDLQDLINSLPENIKIRLVVRRSTLDETLGSIRYHKSRLANSVYPSNLAEAATRTDISGVYRMFFQRVQTSGVQTSVEDYFSPYENNLMQILEGKGVSFFLEESKYVDQDQSYEISEDIALQIQYEKDMHKDNAKSEQKIVHDVNFWHFIQNQRSGKIVSPLQSKFWIVTVDYRFLAFDKFKSNKRGFLPACMHPTQLIQLLRFFCAKVSKIGKHIARCF